MRSILAIALLLVTACSSPGGRECTVPEGVSPDWIRVIRCDSDYELLVTERDDAIFSRTETLNWIVDREDGDRIYFINSREWALHYFFAVAYLNKEGLTPVGTHAEFNILNYRRENRRFLLGKVIRYLDQDLLTIEFSAGDTASADMIIEGYGLVYSALHDGDDLLYRPVSNDHEQMLDEIAAEIPVIRTEDVFLGQTYQPLNPVLGYGTLQFRKVAELAGLPVGPTDIVVLDRVPNDISLVSGVITDEFQTPLSHVNLLSKNRGTPNMGLRNAFSDPELRALEGQLVRLDVGPQEFTVEPAELSDAQNYWGSLRPAEPLVPQFDLSVDALQSIEDMQLGDSIRIGAKAANMGEMHRISGVAIPLPESAFAIPFSFYQRHLEANALLPVINSLLSDYAAGLLTADEARARLFDLRWRIFVSPMDPDDLAEITAAMGARWPADTRLRFRSSTNVEDLAEFSGAGLYTSAGATVDEGDTKVADAIRVVWASAWNHQAFIEREFYRVLHDGVRMGVLVHPAFEDEEANGVAITINEFASNWPAFFINSQLGEVSVTNPTGQAVPEQILYYTWYEEPEYEVITRSSLVAELEDWPGGQGVLTEVELAELADMLERIHNHFRPLYPPRQDFAMDVEFKLAPGRELVIKQARPLATK
ncbi:MAG: hypothetical protein GY811_00440 [Myxococcales bacterium]|nr:hypothetical protein [Myxococcales bacterium]